MSKPPSKRNPLVAERRYPKKGAAKKKPVPKRRARKPVRKKRGVIGLLLSPFVWLFRLIWRLTWRLSLVVALLTGLGVWYYASQLPDIDALVDGRTQGSVILRDREGARFASRGDLFGGMITPESVSPHLHHAIIATEDKRFYKFWHIGVDPYATVAAMVRNYRAGGNPLSGAGGSSISQQTAKLLCFGVPFDADTWQSEAAYEADCRRTTLWRKVKEAVYAMSLEARYTKSEVLSIYLNRAYLGGGARGFEAAAQRYFGKSAANVTPAEAAMLAGLLKAPTTYAPTNNIETSRARAGVVLNLMEDQGYLSASAAQDARDNPATLSESAAAKAGGFFADWAMGEVPDFLTRNTTEDIIVRTTLDQRIQVAAEEAMTWVFDNKVSETSVAQAAIVVMSPDGAVRAMVGGRSGAFNRATQANRQTGSAFKPFIFAAALDLGFSPLDMIADNPISIRVPGSPPWEPDNYDNTFKGSVSLTQALAESRNIPAINLSEEVGRELVSTVARGFGVTSDLASGPALALGVSESTLIEMTGAYAGILNGGSSVAPYGLIDLRLRGYDDVLMTNDTAGIGERVISESAARQLTWMMHQVVETGTGRRAQIDGWQIAAKTGTTQGARDAWFIGFTGDYVVGVWMGNDDNTPLNDVTGGGLPADIWRETMTRVTAGWQPTRLPMQAPEGNSGSRVIDGPSTGSDLQMEDAILNILQGLDG